MTDVAPPEASEGPGPPAVRVVRYTLLERVLHLVTLVMFIGVLVAALGQVLVRYVLQIPVPWTEELARALFVLSMLTAIAFAYREREHVVVDFLFVRLPGPLKIAATLLFDAAILLFLAIWARGAVALMDLNWGSTLITLEFFRVGYFYLWELVAIGLMAIYVLLDIARTLRSGEATFTAHDLERDA